MFRFVMPFVLMCAAFLMLVVFSTVQSLGATPVCSGERQITIMLAQLQVPADMIRVSTDPDFIIAYHEVLGKKLDFKPGKFYMVRGPKAMFLALLNDAGCIVVSGSLAFEAHERAFSAAATGV